MITVPYIVVIVKQHQNHNDHCRMSHKPAEADKEGRVQRAEDEEDDYEEEALVGETSR